MDQNGLTLGRGTEKQVSYLELIYDLIFVYLVGRNNSLLQVVENGFIRPAAFLTYVVSALVVLQIWYYSTLLSNRYGDGSRSEYLGMFINMYLLYHMADGIRADWGAYFARYNLAWTLILINLAVQYWIKLRKDGVTPHEKSHIRCHIRVLLVQAAAVLLTIPIYRITGASLTFWALLIGIVSALLLRRMDEMLPVDFSHLTERVMLYVVFTFGEMIIGIAGYFSEGLDFTGIYFSVMAFAIVVGLFLSYGFLYENILDREKRTAGTSYMMIHLFLLMALNLVTAAMEFMREPEVDVIPKNIFLVAAFLIYYIFLFSTRSYAKLQFSAKSRFVYQILGLSAAFVLLTGLFYRNGWVSIAVSVLYVYGVYYTIVTQWRSAMKERENGSE